jgi:hypothetical protein
MMDGFTRKAVAVPPDRSLDLFRAEFRHPPLVEDAIRCIAITTLLSRKRGLTSPWRGFFVIRVYAISQLRFYRFRRCATSGLSSAAPISKHVTNNQFFSIYQSSEDTSATCRKTDYRSARRSSRTFKVAEAIDSNERMVESMPLAVHDEYIHTVGQ